MSRMKLDRKPPLARSPVRLRPRPSLHSSTITSIPQTPPCSRRKSLTPNRNWNTEKSPEVRPEYRSISCQLQALAKMVNNEFGNCAESCGMGNNLAPAKSPLFERGRFYEEYAAKRNERLRKRKGETGDAKKSSYGLGVTVESAKRRPDSKRLEQSLRKSMPGTCSIERRETAIPTSRYSLRSSSKENKKPPLGAFNLGDYSEVKTRASRSRNF